MRDPLIITLFLIFFIPNLTVNSSNDDADLWEAAKQELAAKTQLYLRENPISNDLQEFIQRIRRSSNRRKRQDHRDMYAIKDGEVVPLNMIEESLYTNSELGENFTVVPLIIPIALENNVTATEGTTTDSGGEGGGGGGFSGKANSAILGRGKMLEMIKGKGRTEGPEAAEETVVDSLIDEKLKSTSESTELNKVLEGVQNLINSQKKGLSSSKEGALCNVSGFWDSEAGGMTFKIKKLESGMEVSMSDKEPPSEDGFLVLNKWNATVKVPFVQAAEIIITATSNKGKKVAIFMGECRICDGSETITGDWMVGRTSTSCKDQKASHSFFADILRKNNVETLREDHLKKVMNLTTTTTVHP